MEDNISHIIVEQLKAIRADQATMLRRLDEIGSRLIRVESTTLALRRDAVSTEEGYVISNTRMDNINQRLDSIERRLELKDN